MGHGLTADNAVEFTRDFASRHVAPCAAQWENARRPAEDAIRHAAASGFAALLVAPERGGPGLPITTATAVFEELAAAHLPFAFGLVVNANLCAAIARTGTAQQKERYLPAMLDGQTIGAFCLTEKSAGSDPASIQTRAGRSAENWFIHGEKAWVTNGAYADLFSVYAQTDPALGSRGIASFLVAADRHDIERLPDYQLLGGHAMGTTGLVFDHVRLSSGDLLAPPGQGFKAAMAGIDLARVLLSGMCCGLLRDSIACTTAYAGRRQAFGRVIADFQGIQWSLADVATELAAARALTYEAARLLEQNAGAEARLKAAQAKKFATRTARNGVAVCMQVMGANALRCNDDDNPLSRHFASAQIAEYLDGTTGIQNVVIARQLFSPS